MVDNKISSVRIGTTAATSFDKQQPESSPVQSEKKQLSIVQDGYDKETKPKLLDQILKKGTEPGNHPINGNGGHVLYAGAGKEKMRGQTKLNKPQEEAKTKLEQSTGWDKLSEKQRGHVTKGLSKLSGEKLNQYVASSQQKLNSIHTISGHAEWGKLSAAQKENVADQLLKSKSLAQTEKNLQGTLNFAGNQIKHNANADELNTTLNNLLKLESKDPKAYEKMTSHLTEASKHIDASSDKQKTAKDIRDMLNISIPRSVGDAHNRNAAEVKTEVFNRFFNQYKKDPADFGKVVDALKNTPGTLQLNWSKKDMVGMNIRGGSPVSDAAFNQLFKDKNIPADQQGAYKHALNVLMQNEGKPDAINTYDSGIVSVGLKQWTTHAGSLATPLKEFQSKHPEKFKQLLPGVDITRLNGKDAITYNGKSLTITNKESSSELIGKLKQSELIEITQKFGNLAKDPDFQAIQLSGAADKITSIRNTAVGTNKVSDYLKTDRGLGHLVDFEANRPAYVKPSFHEAVKNTGKNLGLTSETPTRQELLDGLKGKLNDAEYAKEVDKKYGKGTADKLKTSDSTREEFLERRLGEEFRDQFLVRVRKEKFGVKHAGKLVNRFAKTDAYYDGAEKAAARASMQNKTPTSPSNLQIQSGKQIQIR
jgi:hypothetical protein